MPVLSWGLLRGRCRYCKKPISTQYPIVELATGFIFAISYLFWPANLNNVCQIALIASWLVASVGLMALLVYDLKWMLLPSKMIYPTAAIACAGNIAYLIYGGNKLHFLVSWAISVLVAAGIFFLLHEISGGEWIGFGDVRLGLITGTLLHSPAQSFLMIFIASILGTLFVIPSLTRGKRGFGARLPFGPFLIASTAICLLFGNGILDAYLGLVSP